MKYKIMKIETPNEAKFSPEKIKAAIISSTISFSTYAAFLIVDGADIGKYLSLFMTIASLKWTYNELGNFTTENIKNKNLKLK